MSETPTMIRLERARIRLAEIRREQERQSQYAGLRFGVFARLRELARDERRVLKRIEQLRAQHEDADAR